MNIRIKTGFNPKYYSSYVSLHWSDSSDSLNLLFKHKKTTWGLLIPGRSIEHGHVREPEHPEGTTATWQVYSMIICLLRGYFEQHRREDIINIRHHLMRRDKRPICCANKRENCEVQLKNMSPLHGKLEKKINYAMIS